MNTKIKVIGIGGAGCNTISRLFDSNIKNIELISFNTDIQDLNKKKSTLKSKNRRKNNSRARSWYEARNRNAFC